jgi:hypothetical protein
VVHPGAQLAAQPGVEEHLLQARVEVRLPAQGQCVEQRQQQAFAHRDGRIQGHGLIQQLVEWALRQMGDGLDQLLDALPHSPSTGVLASAALSSSARTWLTAAPRSSQRSTAWTRCTWSCG